jgi:hypothetical protein
MAEAVAVTGTVVAVVEIAVGEAEAEVAVADAIRREYVPRPLLNAETCHAGEHSAPGEKRQVRGSILSCIRRFTL